MAINFEAANMAGYNNPKIEVFKTGMTTDPIALTGAPGRAEIIRCLNRGSIPIIILETVDLGVQTLLVFRFRGVLPLSGDPDLYFSAAYFNEQSQLVDSWLIKYPAGSDTPELVTTN